MSTIKLYVKRPERKYMIADCGIRAFMLKKRGRKYLFYVYITRSNQLSKLLFKNAMELLVADGGGI